MTAPATFFADPPRCVFVTGPRGAARAGCIESRVRRLRAQPADPRCAVLLADERLTGTTRFAGLPDVPVRCVFMPCLCCPAAADLPRIARDFAVHAGAAWLFIEVPPLAAAAFVREFDAVLGWPRQLVVCLNRNWERARRTGGLSYFQRRLLALADEVVTGAGSLEDAAKDGVDMLSLS